MSDQVVGAAHEQLDREIAARQAFARGCGLALLELTAILEDEAAELDRSIDPLGVVMVAFAARGRRLLRSTFRLLDAKEPSEAVPLIRLLLELIIVATWLKANEDRLGDWAIRDHDRRDLVLRKVIAEMSDSPELQATLETQRLELAATRKSWVDQMGELSRGVPNVETMATQIEMGLGYQLAYRVQSQSDVHATPLAADSFYEELPSGRIRLLPAPVHALSEFDQYALTTHALRDLLAIAADHLPGLMWETGLEAITSALESSRASDPRRAEEPVRELLRRAGLDAELDADTGGDGSAG